MSDLMSAGEAPVPEPAATGGPLLPLPPWARNPLLRKGLVLGLLAILFLLPIGLLTDLVQERSWRQQSVTDEIGRLWGPPQTFVGPLLAVPVVEAGGGRGLLLMLPETLDLAATLTPEKRHRGLFETLVYGAAVKAEARFRLPTPESLGLQARQILWSEGRLVVAASALTGIAGSVDVALAGGDTAQLRPATLLPGQGTLEAPLPDLAPGATPAVSFALTLNGSGAFYAAPAGETTRLGLSAAWPHPSFGGAGLPSGSRLRDDGFTAEWQASAFAAGLPPVRHLQPQELDSSPLWMLQQAAIGVALVEPVDVYLMSERAVKYALFVLALTFAAVFLFEAAGKARLHPLQYLLVGAAETLFYLLLLSLTEAVGFDLAYTLASLGTILLIATYLGWQLGLKRGLLLAGGLATVKLYLYVTLASEDFALLSGSLALFLLLAAVMLGTRKVDWYRAKTA